MDNTYITLFKEIAHAIEVLAERVMEYDHQKNDESGEKTAHTMRQDYQNLYDKIRDKNFQFKSLTRAEFAKLLVGAIIVSQQLEKQIDSEKKALQGYKIDTIPKLERIVNETKNDAEAMQLAEVIFQTIENNK